MDVLGETIMYIKNTILVPTILKNAIAQKSSARFVSRSAAEIWNYRGGAGGRVTRGERGWILHSRGKSGAAVSVAGERG